MLDAMKLRLARQLAPRMWRRALTQLAERIDEGTALEECAREPRGKLPAELHSLLQESLATADPTCFLVDTLRIRSRVQRNWQEFLAVIFYPLLLFVFALAVGVAFSFVMNTMVDFSWMEEFGIAGSDAFRTNLADQHHAIVGLGMVVGWMLLALLTVYFVGPAWTWLSIVGGFVVVGKPLRWLALQELLFRYQLLVQQGKSTSEAAEAVARSFSKGSQAIVARAVANRISAGMPLGKAIGSSLLADGLCRPSILLLDHRGKDIAEALEETAGLLGRITEQQLRTLGAVLPAFVLAVVGTVLWGSLSVYLMGLAPLINAISGLV